MPLLRSFFVLIRENGFSPPLIRRREEFLKLLGIKESAKTEITGESQQKIGQGRISLPGTDLNNNDKRYY